MRGYFPAGRAEWVALWEGVGERDEAGRADHGADATGGSGAAQGEWAEVRAPLGWPAVFARRGAASFEPMRERMRAAGLLRREDASKAQDDLLAELASQRRP